MMDTKDAIARVRDIMRIGDLEAIIRAAESKDGAMSRVNKRLRDRLDVLEAEIRRLDPENALVAPSPVLRQMISDVAAELSDRAQQGANP